MRREVLSPADMQELGGIIGSRCKGGEVIVLVGDIGAGKTTFVKGLARSLGVDDDVQSPTFTISRIYEAAHNLMLAHYDFYRLSDPGLMKDELAESMHDSQIVTVIEWAEIVNDVLPSDTLYLDIQTQPNDSRVVTMTPGSNRSHALIEGIV